jgi:hypothetical protein
MHPCFGIPLAKFFNDGRNIFPDGLGKAGSRDADYLRLVQPDQVFQPVNQVFGAAENRSDRKSVV